jgi:hypothetical protein
MAGVRPGASMQRGTLLSFDAASYEAEVQFAGSLSSVVAAVPVSRAIASAELTVGRRLAIALFDAANPTDAMVVGVH